MRWSRVDTVSLFILLIVGSAARFTHIGHDSFWLDEAASWWFSAQPLAALWSSIPLYEAHPPLYYTLLKAWAAVWGTSEAALRSLSAVASVLIIPLVYITNRCIISGRDGRWIALIAATVLALHPTQVTYAQEARVYALLSLSVAAMLACFLLLGHVRVETSTAGTWKRRERWIWLLLALSLALSFWLHHAAVLLVGAMFTGLAGMLLIKERSPRALALLALSALAATLLWLPGAMWLFNGLSQVRTDFWIQAPDATALVQLTDVLLGSLDSRTTLTTHVAALLVSGVLAALGTTALIRARYAALAWLLWVSVLMPIFVAFVASHYITPIFIPRLLLWIQVPYATLIAASILHLRNTHFRSAAAACLAALCLVGIGSKVASTPKENWREVARILAAESRSSDATIAVSPYAEIPLLYYGTRLKPSAHLHPIPDSTPGAPAVDGVPRGFRQPGVVNASVLAQVAKIAADSHTVWYASPGTTYYDLEDAIPRTIASIRKQAAVRVSANGVVLLTEYSSAIPLSASEYITREER